MSASMSLSICGCDEVCVYLFVSVVHGGCGDMCLCVCSVYVCDVGICICV